jgi:hypothetical protein
MQYSVVALAALVATASAGGYYNGTTPVYTTEVVTSYTTYCPYPTTVVHGEKTYTVTEATTLTITDCPCTIVKPVTTSSVVYCNTCAPPATHVPVYPNATITTEVGTTAVPTSKPTTTQIEANSGNKAMAFSGASLAGLLGLAAYIL